MAKVSDKSGQNGFEFLTVLRKVYTAKEERVIEKMLGKIRGACREMMPQFAWGVKFENGGDRYLSIQASCGHYCEPRVTARYEEYESFEVALMDGERMLGAEEFFGEGEEIVGEMNKYECGGVFGYVPGELVERCFQWCKAKFGEISQQKQEKRNDNIEKLRRKRRRDE